MALAIVPVLFLFLKFKSPHMHVILIRELETLNF